MPLPALCLRMLRVHGMGEVTPTNMVSDMVGPGKQLEPKHRGGKTGEWIEMERLEQGRNDGEFNYRREYGEPTMSCKDSVLSNIQIRK